MNSIKKLTSIIFGILFFGLIAAIVPAMAQATDVNVVNTPTVVLPTGSTVGINPANNTVKIDSTTPVTVRGEKTELLLNESVDLTGYMFPTSSKLVNVSDYKQIRIIVTKEWGAPEGAGAQITPYICLEKIDTNGCILPLVPFEASKFKDKMNKAYETPGSIIGVYIVGQGPFRIIVYGRRN